MLSVVIDTHALIWYINEPEKLSAVAIAAFNQATEAGDAIYISSISIIEICYLIEKGRISADMLTRSIAAIRQDDSALVVIAPNLEISLAVRHIPRSDVPDLPDRIIAATAYQLNLPLVSRDRKIQASRVQTIW